MGDLRSSGPDHTIDICGKVCPHTLVLTKRALGSLDSGKVLKVICDHQPAAEDTIPSYCRRQGFEFESVKVREGLWEIYIRKP
jgi:TusA-related sulfurtransferase